MSPPLPHTHRRPKNLSECLIWCWHRSFHDCCTLRRPPHLKDHPITAQTIWQSGFVHVFATKLLLEVLGAAGAVWGFSEVMEWRHSTSANTRSENDNDNTNNSSSNNDVFRVLAWITGVLFLIRFYWHAKHWLEHEHDFPYVKLHHRRQHVIHFIQVFFGAKLLLQVAGAAGAVWGSSEAVGWRDANNVEFWRVAAVSTACIFFVRWVLEIMSYCLLFGDSNENTNDDDHDKGNNRNTDSRCFMKITAMLQERFVPWMELFVVKFILEVCGAVGAVWGCADIAQLRTSDEENIKFWRIVACGFVGGTFTLRWILQIWNFFDKQQASPLVTEPMTLQKRKTSTLSARNILLNIMNDEEVPSSETSVALHMGEGDEKHGLSDLHLIEKDDNPSSDEGNDTPDGNLQQ